MTTTGAEIIRAAALMVPYRARAARQGGQTALTATGGSTTTLADTVGYDFAATSSYYHNWWIWNLTKDLRRTVASGSGTSYSIDGTWTTPTAGDIYMLLMDSPETWHEALNIALTSLLARKDFVEWTPTDGDEDDYDTSAAPISATGLVRYTQIFEVEHRPVGETNERWEPWNDGFRTWEPYLDGETVRLSFGNIKPTTNDRMRLTLLRQFDPVTDLTASIAVDKEWAAFAVLLAMARRLKTDKPGDDWSQIERDIAAPGFDRMRRMILGEYGYRQVARTSQRAGIQGVRGRGGSRVVRNRRW